MIPKKVEDLLRDHPPTKTLHIDGLSHTDKDSKITDKRVAALAESGLFMESPTGVPSSPPKGRELPF